MTRGKLRYFWLDRMMMYALPVFFLLLWATCPLKAATERKETETRGQSAAQEKTTERPAGKAAGNPAEKTAEKPAEKTAGKKAGKASAEPVAQARLQPRSGSTTSGRVVFFRGDEGLIARVRVRQAEPGLHAVHIHEKGDCSAKDASSAGDHYNPGGHRHGAPFADQRHFGDMGNIQIGQDGIGEMRVLVASEATLKRDGWSQILDRAVIVHEKADDFTSQPSGNAGGRVACGVIRRMKDAEGGSRQAE